VTELKDIESLHGRIRTVLAYLDAPVLIVSMGYKTAYINPAFEEAFQVSFRDALGKDLEHFLPPSAVESLVETGEKVKEIGKQRRIVLQQGGRFHSVGASPITDESAHVTGIVYSFTDITKERQLERVKAEFISMLLNDLHAPLFDILETFKRLESSVKRADPGFSLLQQGTGRAQDVVNRLEQLLHITDSISGELRISKSVCDLSLLLSSANDSLKSKAAQEMVSLQTFQVKIPNVNCDKDKILQVFIHLINRQIINAGKGRTVTVSGCVNDEKDAHTVFVCIAQTGKTLAQDEVPEMFPDDELRSKECDPACLAVARIISAHGGSLSLVGIEDMGSTIVLTLPVE